MAGVDEELKDPKFRKVKAIYDNKILYFLRSNGREIVKQIDSDEKYQSGKADIPTIPLFDNFLFKLEKEIQNSIKNIKYPTSSARELVKQYKINFYRSGLPNLTEHYLFEHKNLK